MPGGENGLSAVFLVESMRLDLARRTVVLDCAVLVVTAEVLRVLEESGNIAKLMTPSQGYGVVKVDKEEMRLWKEMLPSWVERCREWKHREGCEYGRDGTWKAPVSVEMGGEVVCGCGKGVFRLVGRWICLCGRRSRSIA
jgi:hypothetical protein